MALHLSDIVTKMLALKDTWAAALKSGISQGESRTLQLYKRIKSKTSSDLLSVRALCIWHHKQRPDWDCVFMNTWQGRPVREGRRKRPFSESPEIDKRHMYKRRIKAVGASEGRPFCLQQGGKTLGLEILGSTKINIFLKSSHNKRKSCKRVQKLWLRQQPETEAARAKPTQEGSPEHPVELQVGYFC